MNTPLPDPIATFFEVSNGADPSALETCFADDAVVHDERQRHQGHEAIRAWLYEARRKYGYRAAPLDAVQQDSAMKVRAEVSGTFPGSPIELDYVFRLDDGRIERLEIGG